VNIDVHVVAAEAVKKWDGGRALQGWGVVQGCHPWKVFENIGAYLCTMVHF